MNLSPNLVHKFVKNLTDYKYFRRLHSNLIKEQFKACDLNLSFPCHVDLKPWDVHKHQELDKVKIELVEPKGAQQSLQEATCVVTAPINANLNVTARGNITCGFFNGSKLILKSTVGNISVEKYNGEEIDLSTDDGDILLNGAVIAANIKAQIRNNGLIKTQRLQALKAHLQILNKGNIVVDASYCDDCLFQAKSGNMDLRHIHKNNRIYLEKGYLNINGLDGHLDAMLKNGRGDIQLSRILTDSTIAIAEGGELTLRLSEDCQKNTKFEILSKDHHLDPDLKMTRTEHDKVLYLAPSTGDCKLVRIDCPKSTVKIRSASWLNMLKLNVK